VTVRDVGPPFSEHDPRYGKRLRPGRTTVRRTPEFTMTLTTNAQGQRGPEALDGGRGGVLFLGDSFTMGYGVTDGDEFPARVRQTLRPCGIPVVNAGIGDNGNGRWLLLLRGESWEPRVVVLQFSDTDFSDNQREQLFRLSASGELTPLPIAPPGWTRRTAEAISRLPGVGGSHLFGLLRQLAFVRQPAAVSPPAPAGSEPPAGMELTARILDAVLEHCRGRGWPVLAVLADLPPAHRALLAERFEARQLIVIPSKRERPELYYRTDGHWTAAGHALAAAGVTHRLHALGTAPRCTAPAPAVPPWEPTPRESP
jgi:hypothetical protein